MAEHFWRFWRWFLPADYRMDQDYQAAVEWYEEFTSRPDFAADEGRSSETHLALAQRKFDSVEKSVGQLEGKAEVLFRFAAVLVGIVITAVKYLQVPMMAATPALICLALAVLVALQARMTVTFPQPLKVADLLSYAADDQRTKALTAASLHCNIVGMQAITQWKGQRVDAAAILVGFGVLLLFAVGF